MDGGFRPQAVGSFWVTSLPCVFFMVKEEDTKEEDPEGRDNADEALKAYRRCLLLPYYGGCALKALMSHH